MPVTVVYAVGSRTIRRVIVSDKAVDVSVVAGEAVLDVPFDAYDKFNPDAFHAFVAKEIGAPTQETRCVEVDAVGRVVAIFSADPEIDKPITGMFNTLEIQKSAKVGDVKDANGKFPDKVQVKIDLTPEQIKSHGVG